MEAEHRGRVGGEGRDVRRVEAFGRAVPRQLELGEDDEVGLGGQRGAGRALVGGRIVEPGIELRECYPHRI